MKKLRAVCKLVYLRLAAYSLQLVARSSQLTPSCYICKNSGVDHTLIIIGGGPIGLACALEAKKAGLDYLILEKGCLVNSLYNYPVNMTFFSTPERLEIGGIPFVSNNAKPTRPEALEYYRRVASSNHVNFHLFEEVLEAERTADGFTVI